MACVEYLLNPCWQSREQSSNQPSRKTVKDHQKKSCPCHRRPNRRTIRMKHSCKKSQITRVHIWTRLGYPTKKDPWSDFDQKMAQTPLNFARFQASKWGFQIGDIQEALPRCDIFCLNWLPHLFGRWVWIWILEPRSG